MNTRIKLDVSSLKRDGQTHVERTFKPAAVDALNEAAAAAKLAVVEAMPAYIDRPTPYTMMGVGTRAAKVEPKGGSYPVATVRIRDQQAQWMQYMILGGTRGPGDFGSTAEGPLVPGADARLDAYGNLPRGIVAREREAGAVWVTLKPGKPPALIRDTNGRLEILALIVHELHYDAARLPFYDIVQRAAAQSFASRRRR